MASYLFYIAVKFRHYHIAIFAKLIEIVLRYFFGCEVSSKMSVGKGMRLLHNGLGVVIHPKSVIGDNLRIHQNVTIGGRTGYGLPIIGNNVMIGAGAVIMGEIKVGDNVKIGANAVVMTNVPDNCVAVGVPARIINQV